MCGPPRLSCLAFFYPLLFFFLDLITLKLINLEFIRYIILLNS